MSELTVIEQEGADSLSELDTFPDLIRLIGIPPGNADDKQFCNELRCPSNNSN